MGSKKGLSVYVILSQRLVMTWHLSKRPFHHGPSSGRRLPPVSSPNSANCPVAPNYSDTTTSRSLAHPHVHPRGTRCMRHGLPHARRIRRRMLLLLLPLRAFGRGRPGKFVDRAVAAGTLENPIAAGADHSRHLAVAWHILPTVPGVPLRIDLGGDGHTANLQHPRHATLRHFYAVRVNLFPDNACQILPDHGRRDFLSPRRPRPVGKRRRLHHRHAFQFIACQVLRATLDCLIAGS